MNQPNAKVANLLGSSGHVPTAQTVYTTFSVNAFISYIIVSPSIIVYPDLREIPNNARQGGVTIVVCPSVVPCLVKTIREIVTNIWSSPLAYGHVKLNLSTNVIIDTAQRSSSGIDGVRGLGIANIV